MLDFGHLLPQLGATGAAAALIGAGGLIVAELVKRARLPKSSVAKMREQHLEATKTALDQANTAQAISEAFTSLVDELQRSRREDRHKLRGMEQKLLAIEARLNQVTAVAEEAARVALENERRSGRNIRTLQRHIDTLCDLMRQAGIEPPPAPILEVFGAESQTETK